MKTLIAVLPGFGPDPTAAWPECRGPKRNSHNQSRACEHADLSGYDVTVMRAVSTDDDIARPKPSRRACGSANSTSRAIVWSTPIRFSGDQERFFIPVLIGIGI